MQAGCSVRIVSVHFRNSNALIAELLGNLFLYARNNVVSIAKAFCYRYFNLANFGADKVLCGAFVAGMFAFMFHCFGVFVSIVYADTVRACSAPRRRPGHLDGFADPERIQTGSAVCVLDSQ